MKKIIICIFLMLLYMPISLTCISDVTGKKIDVQLNAYISETVKPEFNISNFADKSFQQQYMLYLENKLALRNILIRFYCDVRYVVFGLSKGVQLDPHHGYTEKIVGNDDYLFYDNIIKEYLAITDDFNYSLDNNINDIERYVKVAESVKNKLKKINKNLFIFLTPGKAEFCYDKIPNKYLYMYKGDVTSTQAMKNALTKSSIDFFSCDILSKQLNTPAFYKTGHHWSRPFEQISSQAIIDWLNKKNKKKYPEIILGQLNCSDKPFWRDNDIYDAFGIDKTINETYYEYDMNREYPQYYDEIKILLQGESFCHGIANDIVKLYPNSELYRIHYCTYLSDNKQNIIPIINHDWNNVDLQTILDNTDTIVVEMNSTAIKLYSNGFLEYLDKYLDSYIPCDHTIEYMKKLDATQPYKLNYDYLKGIYPRENNNIEWVWTRDVSKVCLNDKNITLDGLEISYSVPELIFTNRSCLNITIYINGYKYTTKKHTASGKENIIIPSKFLSDVNNDVYEIELYCDGSFNPSKIGINDDVRDLSLQLHYVGRIR